MPSGTIHEVVTMEPCIAAGCHYFNHGAFCKMLDFLAFEHFYGMRITNTTHVHAPLILFKLVNNYLSYLRDDGALALNPYRTSLTSSTSTSRPLNFRLICRLAQAFPRMKILLR